MWHQLAAHYYYYYPATPAAAIASTTSCPEQRPPFTPEITIHPPPSLYTPDLCSYTRFLDAFAKSSIADVLRCDCDDDDRCTINKRMKQKDAYDKCIYSCADCLNVRGEGRDLDLRSSIYVLLMMNIWWWTLLLRLIENFLNFTANICLQFFMYLFALVLNTTIVLFKWNIHLDGKPCTTTTILGGYFELCGSCKSTSSSAAAELAKVQLVSTTTTTTAKHLRNI